MEFCEKGESLVFIMKYEDKKKKRYPNEERIRMLSEIASSMDYLHSRNIVHRDLKCENVLIDKSENCKLMDFGLSKISERMSQQKTKRVGTSMYMAPEVVLGSGVYSEKCDVFSYGIMIWILICGDQHPYGVDNFNVEMRVANDPTFRPNTDEMRKVLDPKDYWMIRIAENCWESDPKTRFSFSKIGKIMDQEENSFRNEEREEEEEEKLSGKNKEVEEEGEEREEDEEKKKMRFKIVEMEKKMEEMEEMRNEMEKMKKRIKFLEKENKELLVTTDDDEDEV